MHQFFTRLIFIISLISVTPIFAADKLIFAVDIIRHGDRTPIANIPTVHYQWAEGPGQLTAIGMQQEYQLGVKLRKLYVDTYHLLPDHYVPNTLFVRSTDFDRTLMSAQSLLAGLYPLGTGPTLPSGQTALPNGHQPIPIHTAPKDQDNWLIVRSEAPEFRALLEKYVFPSVEWQKKTTELTPKFAEWSRATGITITHLAQLTAIGDTLFINKLHHVPLPQGLSEEDADEIIAESNWIFSTEFAPVQIGKLTGQDLINRISQFLQTAAEKKDNLKYLLLSGHDSTLLSLMSRLGAPLKETPHYASDLNILLFERGKNDYIVKVNFNDESVMIPGCNGNECTLDQFVRLFQN